MTIIDSSVLIDYFAGIENPHTVWLDQHLSFQRLALTDLNLCEVLQGIRGDQQFQLVRRNLGTLHLFTTGGEELAVATASNYRRLRQAGRTVRKTVDCLIATFCLLNGHSLLHRDRDFNAFEELLGLRVIHPNGLD